MVKTTSAERMKKLREGLKKDIDKYEKHKEKERKRDKVRRDKLKMVKTISTKTLQEIRRKETERKRKYRLKKRETIEQSKSSPGSVLGTFKCPQSLGKAVTRVKRLLPYSPSKKSAVLRKLVYENLPNVAKSIFSANENTTSAKTKGSVSEDIILRVTQFYESDDVSRQAPGIRDVKSFKDPKSNRRHKVQKRHMNMTVKEAYYLFKKENPDLESKIKKSKFYELRPKYVLLASEMPHNVCVCKYHANFIFLIEAINKKLNSFPSNHSDLLSLVCCDLENEKCMTNECNKCKTDLHVLFDEDEPADMASRIVWKQWDDKKDGRPKIIITEGTVEEAVILLQNQLHSFKKHFFVKRLQAKTFKDMKMSIDDDEVLLQIDYAENYLATYQDEIQSAHWSHKQVSVFTACAWTKDDFASYVVASDQTVHDKYSVFACLNVIMQDLKKKYPAVSNIKIFSDGCAGQFKNRYTLANLCHMEEDNGMRGQWFFFATSHGKGAVDGIGGVTKRAVWNQVKQRKVIIESAKDFVRCAKTVVPKVNFILLPPEDVEVNKGLLEKRWMLVKKIPKIQSMHFFMGYDKQNLVCGRTFLKSELQKTAVFNNRPTIYDMIYTDSEVDEDLIANDSAHIVGTQPTVNDIRPGVFMLVEFQSKHKKAVLSYKYAVICQSDVEEDGEVKVMCMRSVGDTGRLFKVDENDVSYVEFGKIISILPAPQLKRIRNAIFYEFSGNVDIFEQG